jgi:hypothetical protein
MTWENLSAAAKVTTALDYASANADRDGAGLDMSGFEGVLMVVKFAAIAAGAVTSIKAQQSDDDGVADAYSDLLGSKIDVAADDDNQIFIIDLVKPRKRFVRLVVDKDAANVTAESALYIQYGAHKKPVVQTVADEVTYERHVSPDEGVA